MASETKGWVAWCLVQSECDGRKCDGSVRCEAAAHAAKADVTFLEGDCAKERGWAGSGTGVDSKCVVGCSRLLSVELVAVVAEVCDGEVDSVIERRGKGRCSQVEEAMAPCNLEGQEVRRRGDPDRLRLALLAGNYCMASATTPYGKKVMKEKHRTVIHGIKKGGSQGPTEVQLKRTGGT